MLKAEPKRLPFWLEGQLVADAKRDDRRAAVLNRFARAVRVLVAVLRLAGFGAPGNGGLLEVARKRGEERDTEAVTAARKILDSGDGEALVLKAARAEADRHEAEAALALEVVVNRAEQGRQANQIEKLKQEKEKAEREMVREQRLREIEKHALAHKVRPVLMSDTAGCMSVVREEGLSLKVRNKTNKHCSRYQRTNPAPIWGKCYPMSEALPDIGLLLVKTILRIALSNAPAS